LAKQSIYERTWFPEDSAYTAKNSYANCYPCHRTVPVWPMAQQSMIAVSLISHHTAKRLLDLILQGNSFAHRVCNIHSMIKWLS